MLIENFIANYARKKNENYLQFKPSETIIIPRNKGNVPTLLYIHVPFCEELCPYCSFNRVRFQEDLARAYFDALRKEIVMYKDLGYDFKALYAGGGTPTILIDELEKTVLLIREMFNITEISVETNPNHLTQDNINKLREMGVNRLSVGVQTFDDGLLKTIERYHKYGSGEDIKERLSYTQGNFQTLNVDMIFNFPTQSMEILEKDLSTIIELMVDQVTYYPLMVSSFTKDIMNKKLGTVDYDRGNEFYRKITEMLSPQYKASTAWCFSRKDKIFKSGATQATISSEVFSSHSEREGEAQPALQTKGATQARISSEVFSSHSEREGEARSALQTKGATQARISSEVFSSHSEREGEARSALQTKGATQARISSEVFSSHSEREGEAQSALQTKGATQARISSEVFSSHSEREGEAQSALQTEGATQAPVIDEYVVNYEEYAGLGSGSIGYLGGSAYANTFDIKEYIDKINRGSLPVIAIKNFSMKERLCYDLLMKLFGLSLDTQQLTQKHGVNAYRYLWSEILFFRLTGGIEKKDSMLMLTKKGQYYWVLMMREFFIGVNNFRDFCRAQNKT